MTATETKPEADHASFSERMEKHPTVEAFPPDARAEAGVILSVERPGETSLRLAKDGHTVLLPQPTDNPDDPLNWSSTKKTLILITVAWAALTADFTSAVGSAPIILQATEWHKSTNEINQTNSINVLMMALGGLIWVPMTSFVGRAPTLFWATFFGLIFTLAATLSPTFSCFYAMRAMTGLFLTCGQTIAVALLKDMYFFHERARKIGLWAVFYITSPYLGPCLGNFVLGGTNDWRDAFWVSFGVVAIDLVLVILFLDETWYNREITTAEQPPRGKGIGARLGRLTGVWQLKYHRTYYETAVFSFKRFFSTVTKPVILLVLFAYLLCFAWSIGINISTAILFALPVEIGGYGYSYNGVGFLYFSPMVGILLGEAVGHFFNDYLAQRYVRKHKGVFEPEVRLIAVYVSAVAMMAGLILLGQALHHHLSVAAVVVGWGMHAFGIMVTSVAVTTYVLDSYPAAPAEVAGWTNIARAMGGFSVGYFQQPWGDKVGYDASFGTQAAVVAFSLILIGITHRYGHILRLKAGPIKGTFN